MSSALGKHMNCGGMVRPAGEDRALCDRCGSSSGEIEPVQESEIVALIETQLGRKLGTIVAYGTSDDEDASHD